MFNDPDFEPAPDNFRILFTGQALAHLDEFVLSWRMGGHPISWLEHSASFDVNIETGPIRMFLIHAPHNGFPARVEIDPVSAISGGIPSDMLSRLWQELAQIGETTENEHAPISVSLGKFSRGDRKVFLAYALTIARSIAKPIED